jgi:hypothetical protein
MRYKLLKVREALVKANELSLSTYNVDICGDVVCRRAGGSLDYAIEIIDELVEELDKQAAFRDRFKRP